MTRAEIFAFNAGVAAVAALAAQCAAAMRAKEIEKPTRFNFATGALQALADEAGALALPVSDLFVSTLETRPPASVSVHKPKPTTSEARNALP